MGFTVAQAEAKPGLACIGRVANVGKAHLTRSGDYIYQPLEIQGYGASQNIKMGICYKPEWFVSGFNPGEIDNKGVLRMYARAISQQDEISQLLGLCGCNEELLDKLATALQGLELEKMADAGGNVNVDQVCDAVTSILAKILPAVERVGYVLGQQSQKTDEVDENGKAIYVRSKFYEVKSFFNPGDEKAVKRQLKRAERSVDEKGNSTFRVLFDGDDVPF